MAFLRWKSTSVAWNRILTWNRVWWKLGHARMKSKMKKMKRKKKEYKKIKKEKKTIQLLQNKTAAEVLKKLNNC